MRFSRIYGIILLLIGLSISVKSRAQFTPPPGLGNSNQAANLFQTDTANADSSENKGWKNVNAKIYYTNINSDLHFKPDTSIDHFQEFHAPYPWWGVDLGNYGSAAYSLLFRSRNTETGLSSGYHVYDLYSVNPDSLRFYNTTNPYSAFSFVLGSKNQQIVSLLHTQNITPDWNFAANIKAANSAGFFSGQTTKSISGSLNTNYVSKNKRYKLKAGLVYNRFAQDENGGILSDSFLTESNFNDRSRIPTNIPTLFQGRDKSAVNNILSDFDLFVHNHYSWGKTDTTYNKDSTQQTVTYIPRFSLEYDFQFHKERHQYNDYLPDSSRYDFIAPIVFNAGDSVKGRQKWTYLDNRISLNGFLGKAEHLLQIQAGIGNRIDHFATLSPTGYLKNNSVNTYLFGKINKEALQKKEWRYTADAQIYLTGQALGDFSLNANFGKQINDWSGFSLGIRQNLQEPGQSYKLFASNFFEVENKNFSKISTTQLNAGLNIPKLKLNITANYFLINNYLYYNDNLTPIQDKSLNSVLQIYGSKRITFSNFIIDNLISWQQSNKNSPIHLPVLMLQEQFAYQNQIFNGALDILTGINIHYATDYYCLGYSPYLNGFFVQNNYKPKNIPQVNAFFNFRLHHFRAFISLSDLQQLLYKNNINAPGYPAENMMFHLGFQWILIN